MDRNNVFTLLYCTLLVQLSLLAVVFQLWYPLEFPSTDILQAYGYWVLLLSLILTATVLAYHGSSVLTSVFATVVFYITLSSHQLLYYSVLGGDTTGEIIDITRLSQFAHIAPDLLPEFSYHLWPANYIFALAAKRVLGFESVIATIDVGYLVYLLLLAIAVWLFAYRVGDPFFAYVASVAYLLLAYWPLNNQFVPQLLALVLLVFLVHLMDKEGLSWRIVEFTLFVALSFTHVVFSVIYPLALMVRPGVRSLAEMYRQDNSVTRVYDALGSPGVLLRRVFSPRTWIANGVGIYGRIVALWAVYFFSTPPSVLLSILTDTGRELAGNPLQALLSGLSSQPSQGGGVETVLLYDLVPVSVDAAVTWGSRLVVLVAVSVLAASFLYTNLDSYTTSKTHDAVDYRAELVVVAVIMFGVAWFLNSGYGLRMLQVAFLPFALFFYGIRNHRKVVVIAIVCLSLLSPVFLANIYVDTTLTAGGNSIGYHETKAGQTLGEYYDDYGDVVAPPKTPYPASLEGRNLDIRYVVSDEAALPGFGPLIHSDRFESYLRYRGQDCGIDEEGTIVYDNGATVRWRTDGDNSLACLRENPG